MPRRNQSDGGIGGSGGGALVPAQVAKLKVAELRAELERLGLATTGKKAELQARLLAATAVDVSAEANDTDNGGDAASRDGGVAESDAKKPSSRVPAPEDSTYLTVSADDDSLELEAGQPSPSERSKNTHARYQRTMFNSRPAENVPGGEAIGADSVTNFSGMELTFLGTSSGSPSFTRNVSSYALRLTDEIWLFDCGEATQHQLMRSNLRYSKITRVFITHMHGDHIFGLPGLICALSGASAEKRRVHGKDPDPLYITGPPGICEFVKAAIACSRTVLGLPLVVTELTAPGNGVAGAGAADGAGSLVIKPSTTAREVIARYEIDESALELIVRLPSAYPLAQAEVSCEERVGVSESRLRKWTLGVAAILKHQNGAVAQSLDRWRRNVDAEFSGVEPCPICYAVVHPVDHQKPRLRCRQCDNAFHAACLYTWFRTSSKSSCPLCVTPWGSSYR